MSRQLLSLILHCDFCPLLCRWCICGWGSAVTRHSYVTCWASPIMHPYHPTWWVCVWVCVCVRMVNCSPFLTSIFFHPVVLKVSYHIYPKEQDFSCSFEKATKMTFSRITLHWCHMKSCVIRHYKGTTFSHLINIQRLNEWQFELCQS